MMIALRRFGYWTRYNDEWVGLGGVLLAGAIVIVTLWGGN